MKLNINDILNYYLEVAVRDDVVFNVRDDDDDDDDGGGGIGASLPRLSNSLLAHVDNAALRSFLLFSHLWVNPKPVLTFSPVSCKTSMGIMSITADDTVLCFNSRSAAQFGAPGPSRPPLSEFRPSSFFRNVR